MEGSSKFPQVVVYCLIACKYFGDSGNYLYFLFFEAKREKQGPDEIVRFLEYA